jgi:hypothetical protein
MPSLVFKCRAWGHKSPWTGHPYTHLPIRPLVGSQLFPNTVLVHFHRLRVFIMLQPSWEPCGTTTIGEGRAQLACLPPYVKVAVLNEDRKNELGGGGDKFKNCERK